MAIIISNQSLFLMIFYLCCGFICLTKGIPLQSSYYKYSRIVIPPPNLQNSLREDHDVFNIVSYGAVGDGLTNDTSAFKSAWEAACNADHTSTILVPSGYTFLLHPFVFTGPCKNHLVFQVDGIIIAPDGPESWPKEISKTQWIIFQKTHGLTVQGDGLINGRGHKWWDLPCKPHHHNKKKGTKKHENCDSPIAIRFLEGKNLTLTGINIMNSPQFHIRFDHCQHVTVDSIAINSPENSPNTDGIHIGNSTDVIIRNSVISNGDDCISIGAGSHNLDIRNMTCGPGHGISIGSLGVHDTKACVSNITVSNCTIKHSDNGVRIKTWQGGFGSVSAVTFDGIQMDTVRNPIIINQYYCLSSSCSNKTSAVLIDTITYSNIYGTYDPKDPPVHLACSDSVPCSNITLSGLDLRPAESKSRVEPLCWNAYGSILGDFNNPSVDCLLEGLPFSNIPNDGQC
ncbi:unnamed protein product [Amaranthus hypochondriacus]